MMFSLVFGVWNAEMMLPNAAAEGMSLVVQVVDTAGQLAADTEMVWVALPHTGVNPSAEHPVVIGKAIYTDNIGNRVSSGRAYVAQLPVFVFPDAVAPGYDSATFWIVDTITWDTAGVFVVYDDEALTTVAVYSADTLGSTPIHQATYIKPGKWDIGTVVLKNLIVMDTLYVAYQTSDTVLFPTNYGYRQGIPFTLVVLDTVLVGFNGAIVVQPGVNGGTWNNQVPAGSQAKGANGDFLTGRDGGGGSGGGGGSFGTQGSGDAGEVCGNPMLVPFMGGSAGGNNATGGKDPSSVKGGPGGGFFGLISDGPVKLASGSMLEAPGGNGWTGGDSYSGGGSGGGVYLSGGVNQGALIIEPGAKVLTPGGAPTGSGGRGGDGRVRTDGAVPDSVVGTLFAGMAMDSVWVCDTCSPLQLVVAMKGRPNSTLLLYAYDVDAGSLYSTSVDIGASAEPLVPETLYVPAVDNHWYCLWSVNVGLITDWTTMIYYYMSSGATEMILAVPPTGVEEEIELGWRLLSGVLRQGEPLVVWSERSGMLEVYRPNGSLVGQFRLSRGENSLRLPGKGVFLLRLGNKTAKVTVY